MRLFAAILLNPAVKSELYRYVQSLKANGYEGSYLDIDRYHVTLAFFGETRKDTADALNKAIQDQGPYQGKLVFDRLSFFAHRREDPMGVLLLKKTPDLMAYRAELMDRFQAEAGWTEPYPRPFLPHVTLARAIRQIPNKAPASLAYPNPIPFRALDVALMVTENFNTGKRIAYKRYGG